MEAEKWARFMTEAQMEYHLKYLRIQLQHP